jgi:hypothetical protein
MIKAVIDKKSSKISTEIDIATCSSGFIFICVETLYVRRARGVTFSTSGHQQRVMVMPFPDLAKNHFLN